MLSKLEIKRLENFIKKKLKDDYDKFDISAHIDKSISYHENKRILREKIDLLFPIDKKIDRARIQTDKDIEEHLNQLQLEKIEEKAEQDFKKSLEKIEKDKTTSPIENIYAIPKNYIKMVAKKFARGLILYGDFGMGKTYLVLKSYKEINENFILLRGHITSLELYHILFKNRDKNLVFDDVNILDNEKNLNMLKACLDENSRLVQYHSSQKMSIPSQFTFDGTITLILNDIPKRNKDLQAMKSRILSYNFNFDWKTKIKLIFELAKQEYKGLSKEERQEIAKWIKDNTSPATENLSLRLLFQVYQIYKYARKEKLDWKKLSKRLIKNNKMLEIVQELLERHTKVTDAEREFIDEGYGSRAKFYRLKRMLK